jgi:peptidoglycan/xylan/chitin deacetylase (PgdA/CDA1 family)
MSSAIVRKVVKATVEIPLTGLGLLLYYSGLAPYVIWLRRHSVRVLMFHALEDAESDFIRGLSINTRPAQFSAHLDFLQKHYQIVSIRAFGNEPLPDRAVVITFDDGLRSVYEHAFPLLKARGLVASCYLNTDVIGNRSLIWLNELTWFLHRHSAQAEPIVSSRLGLPGRCSDGVLIERLIARYDRHEMSELLTELRDSIGIVPETLARTARLYLDRPEIEEMARNGITFGNHSGSHAVLSRLSEPDCREELARARDALQNMPGSIPSLAYPCGCWNEATRRIALELGYTTLLDVEGLNKPIDPLGVGRLNVTSISPAVLFARMELVAPIKFRLKRLWFKLLRRRLSGSVRR